MHIRYISSVETAQIKRGKRRTVTEHQPHIRYMIGIETFSKCNGFKRRTAIEHSCHFSYLSGIEAT